MSQEGLLNGDEKTMQICAGYTGGVKTHQSGPFF